MLSVNELLDVIRSPEVEYVSFDVFDTLVVRPFLKPADLFVLMEQEVQQVLGCRDLPDFSALRHAAEVQARRVHAGREDITLTQIYEQLGCLTGLDQERLALLCDMEIAYEQRYCFRRENAKRLWDAAIAAHKRVIVISDMYLPTETIASILAKNGYEGYTGLFVSGDVGKTKASGHLFEHVQKRYPLQRESRCCISGIISARMSGVLAMPAGRHFRCIIPNISCSIRFVNAAWPVRCSGVSKASAGIRRRKAERSS